MIIERFKNPFSKHIFQNKYAMGPADTWDALCDRLVDDVCGTMGGKLRPILAKDEQDFLKESMKNMRFLAGGRYLYYAGRPLHFWNNCFGRETKVLTDKGWRRVDDLGTANVLSPVDGRYYPAEFVSRGHQKLQEITFKPIRGNSKTEYKVRATRNHHWMLLDGTDTYDLRVGDVVPANEYGLYSEEGFVHGFVFGDGNSNGQLRLCADKDKKYLHILSKHGTVTYPESSNGDPVLYFGKDKDWKSVPRNGSPEYIAGFLKGWLAADGSEIAGNKLCSIDRPSMEWFREVAAYAGIVISGGLRSQIRDVSLGKYEYKGHEIFIQNYSYGKDWDGFKVVNIQESVDGKEEVFCPYEPVHNRIVIDHGIDTFQCYLLRAEEDTREEWAAVVQRSMSCLMSGGGIGIDYSILRPSGAALNRTGGLASGPIPLMYCINEVGRNVMQGGSRRSAIYASLNWQHDDAEEFLHVKDWKSKKIHDGYSMWDAKQDNFNFACPLDMTNISLNYDNNWLNKENRHLDPTFVTNCYQAMSTGEPGFSFNFGDKENETLRNACTEVCSSDDSDVCNLGSINMGSIDSLQEFRDIVRVASKFLVCGTVRADLPYEKVYKVREKNRRLGLGLMGIHEWLLKRGQKYEVTEELHEWLKVYESESKLAADEHCNRLYLSTPVAYRAIAPTGSIGILASTTTGIEPLFAVAYKRRYLTDGTKWKYEYVVDSVADALIREYGLNPDSIDTALKLATDYERRIKFQADVQDYTDMSISSTINLPQWGSKENNEDKVEEFAKTLAKYAPRLRGFTCYPDSSRGGQPLTPVDYNEAIKHRGTVFAENDICEITGHGGSCGV